MKSRSLVLFAFFLTTAFMLSGCFVTAEYLSKAKMEVNPAPEMRGAGEYFDAKYKFRYFGGVSLGPSSSQKIHGINNEMSAWCDNECRNVMKNNNVLHQVNVEYNFEYSHINGSAEILLGGKGPLLWSLGLGINSGVYGFTSLGLNAKHFEVGISAGAWINNRGYEFEGINYNFHHVPMVQGVESSSHLTGTSLLGFYTSLYFGSIGFDVSASMYDVDFENENLSKVPMVFTIYTAVSYRLNNRWRVRAGAVNLQGDGIENMVWSGFGGLELSL